MPATKTAKGKTKSRRKTKPKSKAEQKEINQRNARLSTGPRTSSGKDKSKYNAFKHGMTARTVLLPGEDAAALAARQQHLVDAFQPRNSVELAVIEGMAGAMWKSDRADLAAGLRISERLRHEPLEQAKKEQDEAVELGGRLFWQPSFPLPISTRFDIGKLTEPLSSENAVHPHHPARLKLRLEQTIPGCDWLIGALGDLLVRLGDKLWLSADPFNQEIADADAAEAPGRLAFELGPEGDRYRRYGLSAERLVIKRFGDFLKTRGESVDGTFDPVDVDLQSLLGTAAPHAEVRDGEALSAAAPPHPACGRPLPEEAVRLSNSHFPRIFAGGFLLPKLVEGDEVVDQDREANLRLGTFRGSA